MEDLAKYIIDDMLILIPVLYVIGVFIKAIPSIPDWLIPVIILVVGIMAALFMGGFNVNSVIQGVLVSGTTVFANQLYKQSTERI